MRTLPIDKKAYINATKQSTIGRSEYLTWGDNNERIFNVTYGRTVANSYWGPKAEQKSGDVGLMSKQLNYGKCMMV